MKAYKGFNKDMTCRGFQFEEGKTYEEPEAKLCNSGFHACENPLDCFDYYNPANSVFHEVELEEVSEERGEDSKVCAKRITIGARLDIAGIVKAHFGYVTSHCKKVCGSVAGDNRAVTVENGQSCSAGKRGSASAGYSSIASAGDWGSASVGYKGIASAGDWGIASAGDWGIASAGYSSIASAGKRGSASAGEVGIAFAGEWGIASAGYKGSASAGEWGLAACRGGKVKGGIGCMLALCDLDECGRNKNAKAVIVDGDTIKADTWYELVDGEFVEVIQ
jgi:hypothetical protein